MLHRRSHRTPTASALPATTDLFEHAAIGMAFVSLDGRILRVNDTMCDILGRDRVELTSMSWGELTHPDDRGSSYDAIADLLTGRQRQIDFQKRYLRPDGEVITARATGTLTTNDRQNVVFAQLYDVTEESAAIAAVCAAEFRFNALTTATDDGVFWLQMHPEVRFRYVNDAVSAMTGYLADEIYAEPEVRRLIIHPDDQRVLNEMRIAKATSGAVRLRWVHRDGSIMWVKLRLTVLAEADGIATEVLGVVRDITEQVETDNAWARRRSQRSAASELARTCVATNDSEVILGTAVAGIARNTAADAVAVWWDSGDEGHFRLAAGSGFDELTEGEIVDATTSHAARVRANQGSTSFDRGSVLATPRIGGELDGEGIDNGIGVPIMSVGRVVGVVAAYSRTTRVADPEDVLFVQAIASILGACADQVQFAAELQRAAAIDPLTGVLNRSSLLDELDKTVDAAVDAPVILAICDIDDFRLINAAQGSSAGDDALRSMAACLRDGLGPNVTIGRTGADEFAVVVPSDSGVQVASLADQISGALASCASSSHPSTRVTASIGFASGAAGDSAGDMLAAALGALREAHARGRSQWSQASGHAHDEACRRLDLTSSLRGAVARSEIRAHFQPIVGFTHGNIVGFEALARWERPDVDMVSPAEFIPIAEATGDIHDIGLSILDQACAFLETASVTNGGRELMVTVNLSPQQLEDPQLPERFEEVLSRYVISRSSVCLELTESTLVSGDCPMLDRIHDLERLGVRLALDDFGTGYSSFAYLTQFPIDLLKLDRAFVTNLQDDPRRASVVRAVVSLARDLGITVLAEGIETTFERDALAELNCELGQGFLWSRPLPPYEAAELLSRSASESPLSPLPVI